LRKTQINLPTQRLNRIRVVLAEQNRKNKWLADKLGKNPTTISLWCNNVRQPSLESLDEIAKVLNVDIRQLLNATKD
jgi:putative transcriptional regulator